MPIQKTGFGFTQLSQERENALPFFQRTLQLGQRRSGQR